MSCDLFNNNSGGYVNPGLAPCAGDGDNNSLEFVEGGIGIVSGSEVKTRVDFSDLSIPVDSWNQQTQTLGPGEVTFIQGLTKGATYRKQGFTLPNLISNNEDLNPYFFEIDLSINYYKSFSYTMDDIDASANYDLNIKITDSLDTSFSDKGIKVFSLYDPSTLSFEGQQEGYDFTITNVVLTLIDASQNENSPFDPYIVDGERVDQIYNLVEDASACVDALKYPNTAMQGIIMKVKYPSTSAEGGSLCSEDRWVYTNHAKTYVDVYTPIELTFNADVSSLLVIEYDSSTFLGVKPIITDDVSIADVSTSYDVSVNSVVIIDGSTTIGPGLVIDNSILSDYMILDSSISDSSIFSSSVYFGNASTSRAVASYFSGTSIIDSVLTSSETIDSFISGGDLQGGKYENTSISDASIAGIIELKNSDVSAGEFNGVTLKAEGDPSAYNYISNVFTPQGTNILNVQNYKVSDITHDTSIVSSLVILGQESEIFNIDNSTALIDAADSSLSNIKGGIGVYNSEVFDSSLNKLEANLSEIYNSEIGPLQASSFANDSKFYDSTISELISVQDTSLINTGAIVRMDMSEAYDSSIHDSVITNSEIIRSFVTDSSIQDGVFNEGTVVTNSTINNSWSNVFVLVTNPSTGEKIYIQDDPTLPIDSSSWRVDISNSEIWDSSLNNATVYDSSIYRTYLEDVSLVRCTTYNCTFENSVESDTRTVMIDASIYCDPSIISDTSIFYEKTTKKVDIGMNGCSAEHVMSAGDYLNWITENNHWMKVGDMYNLTTASDGSDTTNLLNGLYVYNAHTYSVTLDYLVFV